MGFILFWGNGDLRVFRLLSPSGALLITHPISHSLASFEIEERDFGERSELVTTLDLHTEPPLPASSQARPRPSRWPEGG